MGKTKRNERRHEFVDPNPVTAAVQFQRPPTMQEQIARYMAAHNRFLSQQGLETPEEADDLDVDDEEHPESPHELVYDADLNREVTRYEKAVLDKQRANFERELGDKIARARETRIAAEAAARRVNNAKKPTKTVDDEPSVDGDDE